MNRSLSIPGVVVTTLLTAIALCPPIAAQPPKKDTVFKSPQEVFEVWKTAMKSKDLVSYFRCLDDDAVDYLAVNGTIGSLLDSGEKLIAGGGEPAKANQMKLQALMAKYGLTTEVLKKLGHDKKLRAKFGAPDSDTKDPAFKPFLDAITDRPAYVGELMDFISTTDTGTSLVNESFGLRRASNHA